MLSSSDVITSRAIILARGLGTRMRADDGVALSGSQSAVAATGVKALIPMTSGRPFIAYSLDALRRAGVRTVCFVVAPEHAELERLVREAAPADVVLEFVVQAEPRGTADAILAAREWIGDETFLTMNADNYYPVSVLSPLVRSSAPAMPGFSKSGLLANGLIPAERIASYALLDVGDDGVLRRIVEKPDAATMAAMPDARVSMNIWAFSPSILAACAEVQPSPRGELELPMAVQLAVQSGMRISVLPSDAAVLDLSRRADVEGVSKALLAMNAGLSQPA